MKRMATWILAGGLVVALACAADARPGPHGGPHHHGGPGHFHHGGPRHFGPPPPPPPPPPWRHPCWMPPPPPPPMVVYRSGPVVVETYSPAPVIRWSAW